MRILSPHNAHKADWGFGKLTKSTTIFYIYKNLCINLNFIGELIDKLSPGVKKHAHRYKFAF